MILSKKNIKNFYYIALITLILNVAASCDLLNSFNQNGLISPDNLSGDPVSFSRINLTWRDNSENESGFKLERSGDGLIFNQIGSFSENTISFSDTGLTPDTLYFYRVRAFDSKSDSDYSNTVNATTQMQAETIPNSPDSLSASTFSASRIDLSWQDNSENEDGFHIERSTDGIAFSQIKVVSSDIVLYSDTGLDANTQYYYRIKAYNSVGDSIFSNTDNSTTNAIRTTLIINHESIAMFASIPQSYIDEVKKMLLILPGESHGRAYGYGLKLLEDSDSRFDSSTNWTGPAESYADQNLRWNRSYLDNTNWSASCGEEDFWTNEAARNDTLAGLQNIDTNYSGDIYFGFGWCWDMTWDNAIGGTVDPEYGCRWDGSTVDGPDGNKIWGLNAADFEHTSNTVSMDTYLQAVESYNAGAPGIKTFFTTGPIDNEYSNESGYQRSVKHDYIRSYVATNGGILFDYADILSWNYVTNERPTLHQWDGHYWDFGDSTMISGDYDAGKGGCHISEEGCKTLAKGIWVMLALDAGWDGN